MSLLGSVGPFDRDTDNWTSYCERLEQFFLANGVAGEEKQRAVLLSACGPTTYKLIRSLVAPRKPTDDSFAELVELVRNHVSHPPSAVVERIHFNSRTQKDGETVGQFVAELRRLSEFCEFGPTLDGMLRDRLVCGVRDSRVQRRLLSEVNLTFSKAFELAKAAELAEKSVADLQRPVDTASVHAVQPVPPSSVSCHRCGGKHNASSCRVKSAVCYNCGKPGHFARVCRSAPKRGRKDAERPSGQAPEETGNTYTQ